MNFTNAAKGGARVTSTQAFADWWYGKTKGGADSLFIDPRPPNGGTSVFLTVANEATTNDATLSFAERVSLMGQMPISSFIKICQDLVSGHSRKVETAPADPGFFYVMGLLYRWLVQFLCVKGLAPLRTVQHAQ